MAGNHKPAALCSLSGDAALFSSTSVENLFIQEFMRDAPGDFVKVYLFGLMHSQYPDTAETTIEKFASALGLELDRVQKAFLYWRNKGLVREKNHGFEFANVRSAMFEGKLAVAGDRLYEHAELSNRIEEAAGGRAFTPAEYAILYDLVDIDGFEEEAVVWLVRHCEAAYGKKLNKTRLESIAREWKQAGRSTEDAARTFVLAREQKQSPANEILAKLGILRIASEAEHKLYLKWTGTWGFSHDAIAAACDGMTGVQKPNFLYLDKRLSSLYEKGQTTARTILEGAKVKTAFDEKVQMCMFRLGLSGMVTDVNRSFYRTWTESYGLQPDAVLLICDEVSAQGSPSFKAVETLAASFARRGLHDVEDIRRDRALGDEATRVFRAAGLSTVPKEEDKTRLAEWKQDLPMELILLAASYASEAQRPKAYLARVLDDWRKSGIRTLDAAKRDREARVAKRSRESEPSQRAANGVHYGNERKYDNGTLDALIEDLTE